MVEESDNKSGERHQKDAEGILLFVSPRSYLHSEVRRLKNDRSACSQPLSPH
jgi:hypothetical protein